MKSWKSYQSILSISKVVRQLLLFKKKKSAWNVWTSMNTVCPQRDWHSLNETFIYIPLWFSVQQWEEHFKLNWINCVAAWENPSHCQIGTFLKNKLWKYYLNWNWYGIAHILTTNKFGYPHEWNILYLNI